MRDVHCGYCDATVVDASSARPQLRVAVGAHHRPIRLPALDSLPVPVLMAARCRCGRDVFYGVPSDATALISERAPAARTATDAYVLTGA